MARQSLAPLIALLALLCAPSSAQDPNAASTAAGAKTYDYVVVGGGTAGVALSARLAEDAGITVALIEAGTTHFGDPNIDVPAFSGVGNPAYDWLFSSTPQAHAAGRKIGVARGKMLGGSSAINGMAWTRASSAEYDALNAFARTRDWSWAGLLPFMQKSESLALAPPNTYPGVGPQDNRPHPGADGFTGPIAASYNALYPETVNPVVQAYQSLGIKTNGEPQSGNAMGIQNSRSSINRGKGVRSYSATTYFSSHSTRRNYDVLLNAQATKVTFTQSKQGLTATGVEVATGGRRISINARKEVILSAGTIQTPQLLELSGIGNATLLKTMGIRPLLDLPAVGENLQEHPFVVVQMEMKPGVHTFDALRNNATFAAEQAALYNETGTGYLAAIDSTLAFLPLSQIVSSRRVQSLLQMFNADAGSPPKTSIRRLQDPLSKQWLTASTVPSVEIIQWSKGFVSPQANKSYVTFLAGLMHPTSRGSVHLASGDPLAAPAIDLNFLGTQLDAQMLLDAVKFSQNIGRTAPFSAMVARQTNPDGGSQTDDALLAYIRAGVAGGGHPIGTAPMAPRDAGGVVDNNLKVYGTTNLRVVDASVLPIQLATHTQATVYAIAEKVADQIKRGLR